MTVQKGNAPTGICLEWIARLTSAASASAAIRVVTIAAMTVPSTASRSRPSGRRDVGRFAGSVSVVMSVSPVESVGWFGHGWLVAIGERGRVGVLLGRWSFRRGRRWCLDRWWPR
jgi:hypothetical protein